MPLTSDMLLALALFAGVTSITPGPNNLMLLASGVNFGFRRTLPHMLGIGAGCVVMLAVVGLGTGELMSAHPALYATLRVAGGLYLIWLAWAIAKSEPSDAGGTETRGRPMSFWSAAAFQWINPKAWVMTVGAAVTYSNPQAVMASVLLIVVVFWAVNLPCISVWVLFGTGLRRFLTEPRTLRRFNIVMALILVASLWPLVADLAQLN
jgi:threonine/homoserine/homoserine lactone efflux protein